MIVYFNISPGAHHGRIEKEGSAPLDGIRVMITVDEARAAWDKVGTITDSNMAFQRLAIEFDFDVAACLKWYRDEAKRERHDPQPGDDEALEGPRPGDPGHPEYDATLMDPEANK
ncbi:MAG: hypothetical protein KAI41_08780 [Hyphomicrobiaceae bacterium]|nr:hypothetical protein [Hyphomicrobiaceae bacterium]MCK5550612.1 hypothetical protein [Hyphomicrobiaceae bacterium]